MSVLLVPIGSKTEVEVLEIVDVDVSPVLNGPPVERLPVAPVVEEELPNGG